MLNILWQLGSGDTLGNCTPSQIVRRCRGYFQRGAGGVLVFHDTKWWTAAALPTVIKNARYDGFQEVMPADLLEEKYNTSLSRLISLPTALPPLRTARRG
jgi:hypothetical protein